MKNYEQRLNARRLDNYRLNLDDVIIPSGHTQFEFLLDDPTDSAAVSFRAFNAIGERLFATNFPTDNWNKFVDLVNRFNLRYQNHIMKPNI